MKKLDPEVKQDQRMKQIGSYVFRTYILMVKLVYLVEEGCMDRMDALHPSTFC